MTQYVRERVVCPGTERTRPRASIQPTSPPASEMTLSTGLQCSAGRLCNPQQGCAAHYHFSSAVLCKRALPKAEREACMDAKPIVFRVSLQTQALPRPCGGRVHALHVSFLGHGLTVSTHERAVHSVNFGIGGNAVSVVGCGWAPNTTSEVSSVSLKAFWITMVLREVSGSADCRRTIVA